ncbi:MAG: serine hydrolase [Bacteroidota bacterium]
MKNSISTFLILITLTPSCTIFAQDYSVLDPYLEKMVEDKQFIGTTLVAQGDSIVYHKGFGRANVSGTAMNSVESQYLIGSITKTFTAIGIMQLFEEGKISLSDPLSKYMALFPSSDKITIRHLLTHKSGIKNYTELPDLASWKGNEMKPFTLLSKVMDSPLAFEPGTIHSYSNTNYLILGIILEQVSGMAYEKYITANILKPAGLSHTGIARKKAKMLSEGLAVDNGSWQKDDYVDPSVPFSAGNLFSSTSDLYAFSKSFINGDFFKNKSTYELMTNFDNGFYALGVFAEEFDQQVFIGHNGGIDGYSAFWCYFLDLDLHTIVLSNSFDSELEKVIDAIVHAHLGEEIKVVKPKVAIQLPVERLEQFVGSYQIQRGFDINTFIENGSLFAQATGQGAFEIYPDSDSSFFATVTDIEIIFQDIENGKAQALKYFQGGGETAAPRKTQELKRIELSAVDLEVLEGTYVLQEGFDLKVFVENLKLYAQATGQEAFELIPASRKDFFTNGLGIEVSFIFDNNGEASELSLFQGGGKIDAKKKS